MDFSAMKHTLEQQRSQLAGTGAQYAPAMGAAAGGPDAATGRRGWPDTLARTVSGSGSGAATGAGTGTGTGTGTGSGLAGAGQAGGGDLVIPSKARLAELRRVEAALARMREGSYGFCQICGDEISEDWLDQSPASPFCESCAS